MNSAKSRVNILIVDDEETVRLYLKNLLGRDHSLYFASTGAQALEAFADHPIDIVLLDLVLANEDGLALLHTLREKNDDVDIIIVSGLQDVKTVVQAMKEGAADFLNKPIEKNDLFLTMDRVVAKRELKKQNQALKEELNKNEEDEVVGVSDVITEINMTISKLKNQEVNVFLVGETGTGKEIFARLLHRQESDSRRPFISVNCAAIPQDLLESVLFGHEKGAFTGATETRVGKFELADGGDIFLDEINCLSLPLQAKLLRVLEEKEVERVGARAAKKVDFRVISACNDDILKKVTEGNFRSDLFYRLNTVTIQLPPLNERREDIIPLAEFFLRKYRRLNQVKTLSPEVKQILQNHNWRGNIRELRNTIENLIIFSKGTVIQRSDMPFLNTGKEPSQPDAPPVTSGSSNYKDVIREAERDFILKTLEKNRWSKTKTCKSMGISRNKLYRKIDELGIE